MIRRTSLGCSRAAVGRIDGRPAGRAGRRSLSALPRLLAGSRSPGRPAARRTGRAARPSGTAACRRRTGPVRPRLSMSVTALGGPVQPPGDAGRLPRVEHVDQSDAARAAVRPRSAWRCRRPGRGRASSSPSRRSRPRMPSASSSASADLPDPVGPVSTMALRKALRIGHGKTSLPAGRDRALAYTHP